MELFLTSYLAGTKGLAREFLQRLHCRKMVCIPTASNVEEYRDYVEEALEFFRESGISLKNLDISKKTKQEILPVLEDCSCLYIAGGNTFYLLQELQKKDLLHLIQDKVQQGMLYMGESAGAILTAPDIRYSQMMDDMSLAPMLKNCKGLSLFQHYILPHHGEFPFEESTEEIIRQYGAHLPLLPINNRQAVVVSGQKYQVLQET